MGSKLAAAAKLATVLILFAVYLRWFAIVQIQTYLEEGVFVGSIQLYRLQMKLA